MKITLGIIFAVPCLIVFWFFVVVFSGSAKDLEEWKMRAFLNTRDEVCSAPDLGFEIKVEQMDADIALARWKPLERTIYISEQSANIDTFAHEVYHMVQTMDVKFKMEEEQEAFMQGSFTECVYNLYNLKYGQDSI